MVGLAAGYVGPPKLTLGRAFTGWTVDVPMLVLIVALAAWYLVSARKITMAGGRWGTGRTISFCGLGLGFWVIATMSWVGVYQGVLFYARATQTVLLVLVVPLFLAMGKPITLLIEAYPAAGRRVEAVIRSRVAKVATFPAITPLALVAVPMSMYFTSWYTAVFASGTIRELTYLILMVPGCVFFWTLLRVDPVPKQYPYGVAMWITAAEVVGDAFFGIAIIADQPDRGPALPRGRLPLRPHPGHQPGTRRRHHLDSRRLRGPAVPRRSADPDDARGQERGRRDRRGAGRPRRRPTRAKPIDADGTR